MLDSCRQMLQRQSEICCRLHRQSRQLVATSQIGELAARSVVAVEDWQLIGLCRVFVQGFATGCGAIAEADSQEIAE